MEFAFIDIVLLAIVILFTLSGFVYGFIQTVGNVIGLIIGILAGGWGLYWVQSQYDIASKPVIAIIIFFVIVLIVSRLVGWIVELLDKAWKIAAIIPGLKTVNRILGALFGFLEGVLVLAALSYFIGTTLAETDIAALIATSPILDWIAIFDPLMAWLFPVIVTTVS